LIFFATRVFAIVFNYRYRVNAANKCRQKVMPVAAESATVVFRSSTVTAVSALDASNWRQALRRHHLSVAVFHILERFALFDTATIMPWQQELR